MVDQESIFSVSGVQYHVTAASILSKGRSVGKHSAIVFIEEVKNEDTNNQCNTKVQMISYFAYSLKHLDSELFSRWRVPGLGLTPIGESLIAVDSQIRTIPLTPDPSSLLVASDSDDRQRLIKAFIAAKALIALRFSSTMLRYGRPS